jgi:glutamyl-Q tRNA(Asp) synthetase
MSYVGRFAPSPTGPLHAGSLVAALASWLDARAHGGRWLLRIEDADGPRCPPGMGAFIEQQLAACGLVPDESPVWQSQRLARYAAALRRLQAAGWAYACHCTRREIEAALQARGQTLQRDAERVYPGTCRPPEVAPAVSGWQPRGRAPAWRFRVGTGAWSGVAPGTVHWGDRRLGPQQQDVAAAVGDFVLQRADGIWAYQLAVVVDDAEQGVTHVVRGEDLADNTARQILLQRALALPTPQYLHTPLVLAADGHKLSKQNGAAALNLANPAAAVRAALAVLGLPPHPGLPLPALLQAAVADWRAAWA